jgi:hypothetical protein
MNGFVTFGSRDYCLMFLLLVITRGADILSTRIATPNLELEANPLIKFLGWRWGIILTVGLCFGMAFWPASAIGIATFSALVASRNFQSAWLMRTMGEERYYQWRVARIRETPIVLYLLCLAGHTLLIAAVGFAVAFYGSNVLLSAPNLISAVAPLSIGIGIMGYAVAVAGFVMLAVWRLRRPPRHKSPALPSGPAILVNSATLKNPLADSCACETGEIPGK